MIKGAYWHEGARADLLRPIGELPRIDGMRVSIVIKTGRKFDCYLDVSAVSTTLCHPDFRQMTGIIGWFPT